MFERDGSWGAPPAAPLASALSHGVDARHRRIGPISYASRATAPCRDLLSWLILSPRDAAWGMDMAVVPSFEICVQVTMALRELA